MQKLTLIDRVFCVFEKSLRMFDFLLVRMVIEAELQKCQWRERNLSGCDLRTDNILVRLQSNDGCKN